MTGEQIPALSSPRDGENIAITIGQPKVRKCVLLFLFVFFSFLFQGLNGTVFYLDYS